MHSLFDQLLDLVFPPRCAGCRRRGALFCATCCASCHPVEPAVNKALHQQLASLFLASTTGAYGFTGAIREAVHTLKYDRRKRIAIPLGDLLSQQYAAHPVEVDAIVAVPLHLERQRTRGFNQAALLAQQLARHTRLPLSTDDLVRVRETVQQAELHREQRRTNLRNAFAWQSAAPPPARILLIDDVITTGATVEAAAQALCQAGAEAVHALALARAGVPKM
jgi:ComF family protein